VKFFEAPKARLPPEIRAQVMAVIDEIDNRKLE
jgi:ABC-type arginine transport system ATPase subunit